MAYAARNASDSAASVDRVPSLARAAVAIRAAASEESNR